MQHYFNVDLAAKYGILESVILANMEFWIAKNKANETNFYEGEYWTYNSLKALTALFPYATQKQIRNALDHLRAEEVVKTGNFNKSAYDRTLWYAITEKGYAELYQKPEALKQEEESAGGGNEETVYSSFVKFWDLYPRKDGKQAALNAWLKLSPNKEEAETIISALQRQRKQWTKESAPFAAPWINGRRWETESGKVAV